MRMGGAIILAWVTIVKYEHPVSDDYSQSTVSDKRQLNLMPLQLADNLILLDLAAFWHLGRRPRMLLWAQATLRIKQ
jgi:hypothetical protein